MQFWGVSEHREIQVMGTFEIIYRLDTVEHSISSPDWECPLYIWKISAISFPSNFVLINRLLNQKFGYLRHAWHTPVPLHNSQSAMALLHGYPLGLVDHPKRTSQVRAWSVMEFWGVIWPREIKAMGTFEIVYRLANEHSISSLERLLYLRKLKQLYLKFTSFRIFIFFIGCLTKNSSVYSARGTLQSRFTTARVQGPCSTESTGPVWSPKSGPDRWVHEEKWPMDTMRSTVEIHYGSNGL